MLFLGCWIVGLVSLQAFEEPFLNPEEASWRLIYTKQVQKDAKK